jgi:hypothetical protein
VTLLSRADWGARHNYRLGGADDPRGGRRYIAKSERTHHVFHHSVIVDTDVSRNIWETLAKVKANMRVIQDARPDLGGGYYDVPYNFVAYLRPNGKLTVCEGRGIRRSAAHTAGRDVNGIHHNISSPATCIAGNTELGPALDPWRPALNDWLGYLKHTERVSTIDLIHPPRGARAGFRLPAESYGHRHLDATACPGEELWKMLPQLSFEKKEEAMAFAFKVAGRGGTVWIDTGLEIALGPRRAGALNRMKGKSIPTGSVPTISHAQYSELLKDRGQN